MKECNVKSHKRKNSKVRAHTRTLESFADKNKKNVLSKRGTGDDYLKRSFKALHPDHSLRKIKIHHNKSGKITATYKYGSGNVAHFTFGTSGWVFNYEK